MKNEINERTEKNETKAEEINNIEENKTEEINGEAKKEENIGTQEKTQEEQDIENIKATTTWIKPIEGTITSKFGQREPTTSTVPKKKSYRN